MLARALFRLPQSLALLLLASLSLGPSPSAATAACPTSSSTRPSQTQLRTLSRRQTDDDPDEAVFPDSLPTQIGFVFPRASEVRVGDNIMLGFLDPLPPVNHTSSYPGLFRQITPLITLANHSVIPLPAWGSLSMDPPFSPFYPPVYPEGWCTVDLQTASVHERAWVVGEGLEGEVLNVELNITWGLPSYTGPDRSTNCSSPARLYRSYFVAHQLSISPSPSSSLSLPLPTGPTTSTPAPTLRKTTTLAPLSTAIPPWPSAPRSRASDGFRRDVAVEAAVLAFGVLGACGTGAFLVRRRRRVGLGEYRVPGVEGGGRAGGGE